MKRPNLEADVATEQNSIQAVPLDAGHHALKRKYFQEWESTTPPLAQNHKQAIGPQEKVSQPPNWPPKLSLRP